MFHIYNNELGTNINKKIVKYFQVLGEGSDMICKSVSEGSIDLNHQVHSQITHLLKVIIIIYYSPPNFLNRSTIDVNQQNNEQFKKFVPKDKINFNNIPNNKFVKQSHLVNYKYRNEQQQQLSKTIDLGSGNRFQNTRSFQVSGKASGEINPNDLERLNINNFNEQRVKMTAPAMNLNSTLSQPVLLKLGSRGDNFNTINQNQQNTTFSSQMHQSNSGYTTIDKKSHISFYKNFPSYTINPNAMSYKQIISKEHVQDLQGKDSPGVGAYQTQDAFFQQVKSRAPSYKISRANRFQEYNKIQEYKGLAPLNYRENLNELQSKNSFVSFTKSKRFEMTRNSASMVNMSPGPADYDISQHRSIDAAVRNGFQPNSHSSSRYLQPNQSNMMQTTTLMNKTLYKMPRIKSKNVYFAEYQKEFLNQNGPGPGKYEFEKVNQSFNPKKSQGAIFTKDSRKLSMPQVKDQSPLHYSQMDEYIRQLSKKSFMQGPQTFGKASRAFDISKMNGLHQSVWQKGINL
eukprot:403369113